MDGSIASAVMLPDQEVESPQPPASPQDGLKRRPSSIAEQDSKRQRVNSIDASIHPDRRTSIVGKASDVQPTGRRERGRERRLFGAALGALSQNPATAAQKRRSEIEKRQRAQREVEEQANDQRKLERFEQRKARRRVEQARFEKESIRIRHNNLLYMAHFLRTETEPSLYYKPWETTAREDRRIQDQIAEAEETIRRELKEHPHPETEDGEEQRHVSRNAGADTPIGKDLLALTPQQQQQQRQHTAIGGTNDEDPSPKDLERTEDHAEGLANKAVSGEQVAVAQLDDASASPQANVDEASKDLMDENGEEVVEATEDTVIY